MKRQSWLMVGGLVVLWVVLALVSPSRTLHLAPFIVAAGPVVGSVLEDPTLSFNHRLRLTGFGVAMAVITTAVLAFVGGLEGPSLLPVGDAALEAYLFAGLGGLGGLAISPIWAEQN